MKLYSRVFGFICITMAGFAILVTQAIAAVPGDANADNKVDGVDYTRWLNNYNTTTSQGSSVGDFNSSGVVDGVDYTIWLNNYGYVPPIPNSSSWNQHAGNAQRTSYSSSGVNTPWKYKWQWNGAGNDGKKQSGHLSVPRSVQPIVGGGRVYMVANNTVYALNASNGSVAWSSGNMGTLSSTLAYDQESLFVASTNGNVYKLNAGNGSVASTFTGSGAFNTAPLLANGQIVVGSDNGNLYSLSTGNLSKTWQYSASSPIVTPSAYSPSRNTIVTITSDLNVHAVNATNGSQIWKVKPTPRTAGNPGSSGGNTYADPTNGWPVIAEQHGYVFVRYRLDWETLWTWNPFPNTNSEIRNNLTNNPTERALFALNLSNGQSAFVPLAGNGGAGDGGNLPMGPQPVVRVVDGKEVAYIVWRNGQTCGGCGTAGNCNGGWCDGREDATMGEMVLDSSTVSGYAAGDVRFVKFIDIQTDEMMNLAMAGDTLFHSHWLINAAHTITNRAANLGSTFSNPIQTNLAPQVIWRQCYGTNVCNYPGCTTPPQCGSSCQFNAATRYCSESQRLFSYGDGRSYNAGFYEYHNDMNSGSSPFTVAGENMILVKTNDGAVIALMNGNPTSDAAKPNIASSEDRKVLSVMNEPIEIGPSLAKYYIDKFVTVTGTIKLIENNRPKAMYLSFSQKGHDDPDSLLVRIFEKDLAKFNIDFNSLKGKEVVIRGLVSVYWPDGRSVEIVVTNPSQIEIK